MMKKIISFALVAAALASTTFASFDLAAVLRAAGIDEATIATIIAAQNATTTVTTGSETTYTYSRLLKVGKRGDDVRELQTCLNRLGNNTGSVDGIFGPNTKAGVKSFQAEKGLVVDGIIGPQTGPQFETACAITTTTTTTTTGTVTGDKLVVSGVASDDMVVGLGQTVTFLKLTLEAGDEDVDVKDINVEFTGSADADVIDKVLLLNSAMVEIDSDGIDSDDEAKLDVDLEVKDGESLVLYIAARTDAAGADFTSADNGLDISLKVTSVTTDGTDVEGDSIEGATHELHDAVSVDKFAAKITMDETGSVRIGESDLKVATINVENKSTGDDKEIVKSIELTRINHTGSLAGDDALDNVEIKVGGKTYKATQDDEDYTFDFGDGIELAESGDDEDFEVRVDIKDDAGDKFAFMIKDIVVIDEDGVLLKEDDTTDTTPNDEIFDNYVDGTDEATIDTSDVVIDSTNDVSSGKTSAGAEGVDLASFDVEVTGSDVEGDLKVTFKVSGVNIEELDGDVATTGTNIITDLKDLDVDNMAIYTKSGSKISDKEDTSFSITPVDGTVDQATYVVTFDDLKFESDEDAQDFVIKADINSDAPDGTKYEVTKLEYKSVEDENGDTVTVSPENVTSPAIIEVEGAIIAVSVEDADDQNVNSDTDSVIVAKIKLDAANSGDDIKVKKIKLAFTATDNDGGGEITPANPSDDLKSCELFDGNDPVSNKEDGSSSVTYNLEDGDDSFVTVTKDTEKTLLVKCDISDDFENADTIIVTGVSFDAEGVNTGTDLDATFTSTTQVLITDGSVEFALSTDDVNDTKVVRDNAENVVFGNYEFKAKDAELVIDDITATFVGAGSSDHIDGKMDLYIDGSFEDSVNVTAGSTTEYKFENLSKTVAKNATVEIEFRADVKTAMVGGINLNSGVLVTTEEGINASSTDPGPSVAIVAAIPVVTKIDTDSTNLETANDVTLFAYKVKAEGGDIVLGDAIFDVVATNVTLANTEVKVYDNSSMSGSAELEIDASALTGTGSFTADLSTVTVSENDTYYVFLVADTTTSNDTRVLRVEISDELTKMTFTDIDDVTAGNQGLDASLILENDMKSLLKKDN